jgi:NAD+ synthetase
MEATIVPSAKSQSLDVSAEFSDLDFSLDTATLPGSKSQVEMPLNEAAREVSETLIKTERSYKVAVAQIKTNPGQIAANTDKAVEKIEAAKKHGANLVIFPEATLNAYTSMDLQFNREYVRENLKALDRIKEASEGITVVIGFVDVEEARTRSGGRPELYNSAAVIKDGQIVSVQDKTHLPNYNLFFEDRYYSTPRQNGVVDLGDIKLGTTICEDIWAEEEGYAQNPAAELVEQGADLLVNLSASPFHLGKQETRQEIITGTAAKHHVPCVYTNLVGGFDGYEGEVVFDGRSMVADSEGNIIAAGKSFEEDLMIVDVFKPQEVAIPTMGEMEELHDALVLGIKDFAERCGHPQLVIGLSGGIDSALVAALAVEALGPERVLGITMPSKYNSDETKGAAYELAANLGIQIKTVPIQGQVDATIETLRADPDLADSPEDVAEENVQARVRMTNLMYYANKVGGIVLNTGNKTERALNNFTIYGDAIGALGVLGDVDKDRVYALSRYINERAGEERIPIFSIETPATAELKEDQTDADVMGGEPEVMAPLVRAVIEEELSRQQTLERFGDQFTTAQIDNLFNRLDWAEGKGRQTVAAIKVTPRNFGNARKVPMSHGYRG